MALDPAVKSMLVRSRRRSYSSTERPESDYLGALGKRLELDVTVIVACPHVGRFGAYWWHLLVDADGNFLTYEGSKWLGSQGMRVRMRATVASHLPYKGRKQTRITRPKVLSKEPPLDAGTT